MQRKIQLLSTRPLEEPLVRQAASVNIIIDTGSFIQTRPVRNAVLQQEVTALAHMPLTVVFTSMNAAEAVADCLCGYRPQWKIFAVGPATKQLVYERFGVEAAGDDAASAGTLADAIIRHQTRDVVFFCGDRRRDELPEKLTACNIGVKEVVVYTTVATAQTISKQYDGILFFSPSAVESFFSVNNVPPLTVFFAIGNTTAACLRQHSGNPIVHTDLPGKSNLVEKAVAYFNHIKPIHEHN